MKPLDDTRQRASRIRLMAFDVDGVLSDGSLFYSDNGTEIKAFNSQDGLGLRLLEKAGITLAIITGRNVPSVEHRARALGITHLHQGSADKLATMTELLDKLGLSFEEAGYMGDDLIDIRVMAACGFSATPADGHERVRPYARLISSKPGGRCAVREVCDFILDAQGKLDEALEPFLPVGEK